MRVKQPSKKQIKEENFDQDKAPISRNFDKWYSKNKTTRIRALNELKAATFMHRRLRI